MEMFKFQNNVSQITKSTSYNYILYFVEMITTHSLSHQFISLHSKINSNFSIFHISYVVEMTPITYIHCKAIKFANLLE